MKNAALASAVIVLISSAGAQAADNRCGWIQNPTPGNWWLTDAGGQWTIMTQGTYEAPGMDLIGDISAGDYVANNGNYGYACGCMKVDTDGEGIVTRIYSFRQLPLGKCQNDSALPAPG